MDNQQHDFPKIGRPATSALLHAGYTSLDGLAKVRGADILKLHGMGPKAMGILRQALADKGLAFADES
jgi:predicted Fe-Mo cluster-binding NifX family protein